MWEWWQRREHRWGLALGLAAMAADLLLGDRLSARPLANPLPLFLALGHLIRGATRGLLYWNVQPALLHLGFLSSVVSLGFVVLAWRKNRIAGGLDLVRTAMVAVTLPILIASLPRIDHPIVAFYYLLSAAMSVGWTLFLSRQLNRILVKIGYDGVNQ